MTVNEAKAFLASIGYTPGINATSEPKFKAARARIKKACSALKAAGVVLEAPAPVPVKTPKAAPAPEADAVAVEPAPEKPKRTRARKPKPVTE